MKHYLTITSLTLASLLSVATAAEQNNFKQQLNVTANILKTSVNGGQTSTETKIRKIDTLYLAEQGAVFDIFPATISRLNRFEFHFSDDAIAPELPAIPAVPEAPEVEELEDVQWFTDGDELQIIEQDGVQVNIERMLEKTEAMRQLAEQKRDLVFDRRDIQRELNDVNFQLKRADNSDKKQLEQQQAELKQQLAKVNSQKQQLAEKLAKAKQQRKAEQAEQEKRHLTNMKQLTQAVVENMCLYGKSLKDLPKKQHITLVFHDAGDKVKHRYLDTVMVFTKEQVQACAKDEINAKQLLSKANIYQY